MRWRCVPSHAQRTIEILQLPFFLASLVFWLFLASMVFRITLSLVHVCIQVGTPVLNVSLFLPYAIYFPYYESFLPYFFCLISVFLVPSSSLPSVLISIHQSCLLYVFYRFLRFLSPFLSQFPISTLSSVRLRLFTYSFLVNPIIIFVLRYSFLFYSFLSVFSSHLLSSLNSFVFVSGSIFFCLCQSLPLYQITTHVSSCGNVSICIRKVLSSNLSQNTIRTEKNPSIFRVVDYANNRPLWCDTL